MAGGASTTASGPKTWNVGGTYSRIQYRLQLQVTQIRRNCAYHTVVTKRDQYNRRACMKSVVDTRRDRGRGPERDGSLAERCCRFT